MSAPANGSDGVAPTAPDAHGQAALLLVESLMHGLIEQSVITTATAIDIVETAAEVKVEIAETIQEPRVIAAHSLRLLAAIRDSLTLDLGGATAAPPA